MGQKSRSYNQVLTFTIRPDAAKAVRKRPMYSRWIAALVERALGEPLRCPTCSQTWPGERGDAATEIIIGGDRISLETLHGDYLEGAAALVGLRRGPFENDNALRERLRADLTHEERRLLDPLYGASGDPLATP